jgi:hypothetical protein
MSGITPKQNAFKFKIAPHKQKSIVIFFYGGTGKGQDCDYDISHDRGKGRIVTMT